MQSYSPFFQTVHDEPKAYGDIGRGTHYSVLRAAVWHDQNLMLQKDAARILTFAVIWDEDHDTRVIHAAESLYVRGLLPAALFIGERKGSFSFLTQKDSMLSLVDSKWSALQLDVQTAVDGRDDEDFWPAEVHQYTANHCIIQDDAQKSRVYLENIKQLWNLGVSVPKLLAPPAPVPWTASTPQ
jgi:hypothetical protein